MLLFVELKALLNVLLLLLLLLTIIVKNDGGYPGDVLQSKGNLCSSIIIKLVAAEVEVGSATFRTCGGESSRLSKQRWRFSIYIRAHISAHEKKGSVNANERYTHMRTHTYSLHGKCTLVSVPCTRLLHPYHSIDLSVRHHARQLSVVVLRVGEEPFPCI